MAPFLTPPSLAHNANTLLLSLSSFATAAVYEDWSLDQSVAFLKEQGIKVRDSDTFGDVQKLVAEHADSAATVSIGFGHFNMTS